MRGGWSRRAVLGAAGGVGVTAVVTGLAGCDWLTGGSEPPPDPDPLEPLLSTTRSLVDRYDEVIAALPDLAGRLRPVREAHAAHERALREAIGRSDPSPPRAGTWLGPTPGAGPDAVTPGADRPDREAVLETLREAERAGRSEAVEACLAAPPERCALLGSVAAARATHLEVLT